MTKREIEKAIYGKTVYLKIGRISLKMIEG
jgi:hypothetical protein